MPYFLRRRFKPFSWLRRHFGFVGLAGLFVGAAALMIWHDSSQPSFAARYVRVIDGDTLHTNGGRIRLDGIDALELRQTCRDAHGREWSCGLFAKARLSAIVSRGQLVCTPHGHDRYGRTLATCSAGDVADIAEALVHEGLAVDYIQYSVKYLPAEIAARIARRGVWRGTFERPDVWRHRRAGLRLSSYRN